MSDSGARNKSILWNVTLKNETDVCSETWLWRTKQIYSLKRDSGEQNRCILLNVTLDNVTEVSPETWLWRTKQTYALKCRYISIRQHYTTIQHGVVYQIYTVNNIYYEMSLYSEDGGRVSLSKHGCLSSHAVSEIAFTADPVGSYKCCPLPLTKIASARGPLKHY